jgi:site-specific DNA-methyltransferase (adenine-specific)
VSIYYQDDQVTLYHGDCLTEHREWLDADVLVTDPPYGIAYASGARREKLARSILGDKDTRARDAVLDTWGDRPSVIFGTWRIPRPERTRALLIWDTKGALGMGALDLPWKPAHQEVYIAGHGFEGRRTSDVLSIAPVQSTARNGRNHPHEKPLPLMHALLMKCPPGTIADPFAGSGSTLVAARNLGRKAIGIELEERYCEIIAARLSQGVLDLEVTA